MFILLFILFLALAIVSIIFYNATQQEGWCAGVVAGGMVAAGLLVAIIVGVSELASSKKLTQKINMYTEENVKIEAQVTTTVEKYLEHEYNIYDSLQGEDIQTLLVVYPEINSNELVKRQIEVFIENNNKIKELKNKQINLSTWRFLIYFGS